MKQLKHVIHFLTITYLQGCMDRSAKIIYGFCTKCSVKLCSISSQRRLVLLSNSAAKIHLHAYKNMNITMQCLLPLFRRQVVIFAKWFQLYQSCSGLSSP